MAGIIQKLDQELINKIAAGEVVERPASVVKELIENSLDAKATSISVEIKEGGLNLIRVTDNGCGMDQEDARLCVERHATSKVRSLADLASIQTLGFRGEALAAISAVSDFKIITRPQDKVGATLIKVERGAISVLPGSGPQGTIVEAVGLFHTVPARKKFLKSATTEFRYITEIFTHQALLTPHVAWKLIHNNKTVADYPMVKDWVERVKMVLGKEATSNLIEIKHRRASLIIHGFISHPHQAAVIRKHQYLFVNNRPVNDFLLAKAVKEGYGNNIPGNRFPAFVLQISIAPDLVDVNVHPRKSQVKFADSSSVFRETMLAVSQSMRNITGSCGGDDYNSRESSSKVFNYQLKTDYKPTPAQTGGNLFFQNQIRQTANNNNSARLSQYVLDYPPQVDDWGLIGQIHNSYILVENYEGLMIIDQHAAAERILYEKMLAGLEEPKVQQLLVPLVIELSPDQYSLVLEQFEAMKTVGIEGEDFGKNSFRLTGLPQDLPVREIKQFFFDLLADMQEESFKKIQALDERQKRLLKYAACRAAIKFGDKLSQQEQLQLLKDIKTYQVVACIHGRPVMWNISKQELEKKFQR